MLRTFQMPLVFIAFGLVFESVIHLLYDFDFTLSGCLWSLLIILELLAALQHITIEFQNINILNA